MHLLDTDILVDVLRGHAPALAWFQQLAQIPAVPGLVVMELIQGCADKAQVQQVQALVAMLPRIWPTQVDCDRALSAFPQLHLRDGTGLLDVLVAETAIGQDATLCTFNLRHYRGIAQLKTEQPYAK
jgi:predicted nucleic acid-binding protein